MVTREEAIQLGLQAMAQSQVDALGIAFDTGAASTSTGPSQADYDALTAKMQALQVDDDAQKAIIAHVKELLG